MSYSSYPNAIDGSIELPLSTDNVTPVKAEVTNRLRDSVLAVQKELGIQPSSTFGTVKDRLDAIDGKVSSIIVNNVLENLVTFTTSDGYDYHMPEFDLSFNDYAMIEIDIIVLARRNGIARDVVKIHGYQTIGVVTADNELVQLDAGVYGNIVDNIGLSGDAIPPPVLNGNILQFYVKGDNNGPINWKVYMKRIII